MKTKIILAATLISLTATLAACNGDQKGDQKTETSPTLRQDLVTQPQAETRSPAPSPGKLPSSQPSSTTADPQEQANVGDRNPTASDPSTSEPTAPQTAVELPVGDRTQPAAAPQPPAASAANDVNNAKSDADEQALHPASPLPKLDNVKFGSVQYLPSEATPDRAIEQAINQAMPAAEETRYYYNRVDLSGDGNPEAIVYLVGSYTCGSGGCTLMVMEPQGQTYSVVAKMTLVNAPVLVASETSAGWNDLVIPIQGGGAVGHYARLQFDGNSYPRNPSTAPEVTPSATLNGTAIITDATSGEGGIQLAR